MQNMCTDISCDFQRVYTVCPVINGPEPDLPPLHFEELLRFGNSTTLMPQAQQCHIMSRMEAV